LRSGDFMLSKSSTAAYLKGAYISVFYSKLYYNHPTALLIQKRNFF